MRHQEKVVKYITDINKQIENCKSQLIQISQAYDPQTNLIGSIEGHILNITEQIKNFEKEKERIVRQIGELQNLIGPQLDTLLYHKMDCIQNMSYDTLTNIAAIEFHAYFLNGLVSILEKLRAGWNTYLGFLKLSYVDILEHVQS